MTHATGVSLVIRRSADQPICNQADTCGNDGVMQAQEEQLARCVAPIHGRRSHRPDRNAGTAAPRPRQDIAALTVARDLGDLWFASAQPPCSPRLPGVARARHTSDGDYSWDEASPATRKWCRPRGNWTKSGGPCGLVVIQTPQGSIALRSPLTWIP
jgi:hypothetical protein